MAFFCVCSCVAPVRNIDAIDSVCGDAGLIDSFSPTGLLKDPHLQSALATKSPRRKLWRKRIPQLEQATEARVLDCGDGVRLLGYHALHPHSRGLAVFIHGWEGDHNSAYLYPVACVLYHAGYSILRLDLRDHGNTHALNELPFHCGRIAEVIGAIRTAQRLTPKGPLYCIGFSLGGNFALRVGLFGPDSGVRPRLCIGISPVINPDASLHAIDGNRLVYCNYFLNQWHNTLRMKARAWPGRFDFSSLLKSRNLIEATRIYATEFTEYGCYEAYLQAYTLSADMLTKAATPLAIVTAMDDPVIPYSDFTSLRESGSLHALLTPTHGGHCGFIENWRMHSWLERSISELIATL